MCLCPDARRKHCGSFCPRAQACACQRPDGLHAWCALSACCCPCAIWPLLSNYIAAPLATQGESLWLASHAPPPPCPSRGVSWGPKKAPSHWVWGHRHAKLLCYGPSGRGHRGFAYGCVSTAPKSGNGIAAPLLATQSESLLLASLHDTRPSPNTTHHTALHYTTLHYTTLQ